MAFTYNLASADASIVLISRVRLEIGDTVNSAGVLPDGGNLTDAEIQLYLTQNGGDVALTVSSLAGVLARRWATVADVSVGPRSESLSQIAKAWERQASTLPGGEAYGAFAMGPKRIDGYSEYAESLDA